MPTLFISDLHLTEARPEVTDALCRLLRETAPGSRALYILGDLFDAYIGDDDDAALLTWVAAALRTLSRHGVPIYFVHGNRDFLLGNAFAERAGLRLLDIHTRLNLYGVPTLLLHGDTLCTDDTAYQQWRAQCRQSAWQNDFLAQPLPVRRQFALTARAESARHTQALEPTITDVNPVAVQSTFVGTEVQRMIHGHTHRPAIHPPQPVAGSLRQRIVLGDWDRHGSVLRVAADGLVLDQLPFAVS
ncbi:MAG: UDP-2,3-diacylglucosamine diphosphatase [Lysobacterales bacterium CG_4_9_14_3_um_filter_62_6]|nr:MAG: UDP-2,3-diacylglucosamine diphosphatase [Xanthomonadales bacterium CG_4_9_14_3_um_filter_62_6]